MCIRDSDGAGHAHQRLVREHDGALEHRVDVHTQLEGTQVVEELRLEQLAAAGRVERAQVGHVLVRERELVHEVGQLRPVSYTHLDVYKRQPLPYP